MVGLDSRRGYDVRGEESWWGEPRPSWGDTGGSGRVAERNENAGSSAQSRSRVPAGVIAAVQCARTCKSMGVKFRGYSAADVRNVS